MTGRYAAVPISGMCGYAVNAVMMCDMAKWLCRCGEELRSSGDIPHPHQWMLTSDQDFEAFTGLVQAEDVYTNATLAFRCPTCGRLHIFWRGWDSPPSVYAPEA